MSTLLGALLGMLVAGGLVLVILGGIPAEPAPVRPRSLGPLQRARRRVSRRHLSVVAAAGVLGIVIAALSGWVIAIVVFPVAALAAPTLMSRNQGAAEIAKMEALEEWVRALRGVINAGMPLTEGIVRTLDSSPAAIRPQVEMLVARLQARRPVDQALYAFADDIDDPLGDLVSSALIIGAAESGVGLSKVLESLAGMLTKKVRSRRRIESDRAGVRKQARMVIVIVAVTFPLFVTQTQFGASYHSPGGQLMLAVFCALFGLCFWWLHRRASFEPLPRFLITPAEHKVTPSGDRSRS